MLMNLVVAMFVLVIIGAIISIWTRDLLSALIAMAVSGVIRTMIFVLLGAPEIAIAQVIVEVLLFVVLVRSSVRRELNLTEAWRSMGGAAVAASVVALMLVLLIVAFADMPKFGQPVMERVPGTASEQYLIHSAEDTGNLNVLTAILLNYRPLDTLGQLAILFTAAVGAVALLRRKTRRDANESNSG